MFTKTKALGVALSLFSANAMAISVTTSNDGNLLANTIRRWRHYNLKRQLLWQPLQSGTFTDGGVINWNRRVSF